MTDRWALSSSYFRSQSQSYFSLSPDQHDDLQKVKIQSTLPVLCWIEKFIVLVDFFQVFSVIWQAANPYPWPYLWIQFSRPLCYINLDFFSMSKDGALAGQSSNVRISRWGEMDGYLNYALGYAIAAAVLAVAYYFCLERENIYGQAPFKYRLHCLAAVLLASYFMYLPCATAVFRIYYCDAGTDRLGVDPSVDCWNWLHGMYLIVCTIFIAPLFIGLPIVFYQNIRRNLIYSVSVDHEKRIQMWELLYMLQLDDYWLRAQVMLTSSYRLFGAYFPVHMLMLKAGMILIFIFVRDALYSQAALMWMVLVVFGLYYTTYIYPFRSFSTNIIFGVCWSMHIFNMSFAVANSADVKSAVMVGSTQYLFLIVYNCICYFAIFVVCCHSAFGQRVTDWPAIRTLDRIYHDAELLKKVAHWVEVMRESNTVLIEFLVAPIEIADINALEECIRMLRGAWSMAKACGSIFETPIGEVLEQMVYVHSSRLPYALRKFNHWNTAYQHAASSGKFAERRNKYYLMNDRKRRMLMKLLSYRSLQGKRRGNFSFDNVAEYKRMTAFELEMRQKRQDHDDKDVHDKQRRFSFAAFSQSASKLMRTASGFAFDPHAAIPEDKEEAEDSKIEHEESDRRLLDEIKGDGEEDKMVFTEQMMEDARKMIERLQVRTEKALNKFHQAKKTLLEQQLDGTNRSAINLLLNQSASNISHAGGAGLAKISTLELMRRTVDVDEQQDLEDLFHLWDDAIQLYEQEQFPGDYEKLNIEVENWYAYRGLVSQRLELIFQFLQEQEEMFNEIGGQIIEEGDELAGDEDEESGRVGQGGLVSDEEDSPKTNRTAGRLVSDNEDNDVEGGRLISDDEEEGRKGGRLVSDDEDDDFLRDDIMSSKRKKGVKKATSKLYREDIDDDEEV